MVFFSDKAEHVCELVSIDIIMTFISVMTKDLIIICEQVNMKIYMKRSKAKSYLCKWHQNVS